MRLWTTNFKYIFHLNHTPRKTYRYSELPTLLPEYSVQMWENTDQNNSEYEHFSRSNNFMYLAHFTLVA